MGRVIAGRIAWAIPTLWLVVTLSFFLMRAAPGGPFDLERPLDPAVMENLARIYRLDEPLWRQYLTYLTALAHGDLGPSYYWRDFSVAQLFSLALPISAGLGALALALALVVGSAAGALAAARAGRPADHAVTAAASLGDCAAELRRGAAVATRLRPRAEMAAGRRLGRGRSAPSRAAGRRARGAADRRGRASDALRHGGGARGAGDAHVARLRPSRPRRPRPCVPRRADPADLLSRPGRGGRS